MGVKTNAMRILEGLSIDYSVHSYRFDEDNLDAVHAAQSMGLEPDVVFKTIVFVSDSKDIFVFCTPAAYEVNLKKAREITGSKKINSVPLKDLQKLTGYVRGGCSPLGMIKKYRTFIEESALLWEKIYVSAGQRGLQLCLEPKELARACSAEFKSFI